MKDKKFNTLSLITSIIALVISLVSVYFQFFYIKHSLLYVAMPIEHNDKKDIDIPLIFRNRGNQEEIILNTVLYLELKTDSVSHYKRISNLKSDVYPLMLAPNEHKLVMLSGNYEEYFKGLILIDNDSISGYCPVTYLDNLWLVMDIEYLSSNGSMNKVSHKIAEISFTNNNTIKLIHGEPVILYELEMDIDSENTGYYTMPKQYSGHISIDLQDSSSMRKNKDKLLMIESLIGDSLKNILPK